MHHNELPEALQQQPSRVHPQWAIKEAAELRRAERARIAVKAGVFVACCAVIVALTWVIAQ